MSLFGRYGLTSYIIWNDKDGTFSILAGEQGDECVIVKSGLTESKAYELLYELQKGE